jgi:hypothetical protein
MIQQTEIDLMIQENRNSGTSWTHNAHFDRDGYLVIKDLWNVEELYHPVPEVRGQYRYQSKNIEDFIYFEVESQVEGSLARYWHPQYKSIHNGIRLKLEEIIGRKLCNTYYYDRFYFPGQPLLKHVDRDACEISVSVHISTNLTGENAKWPFKIKTPDVYTNEKKNVILRSGEVESLSLEPGDALLYKGCERPHWREAMPTEYKKNKWYNWYKKEEEVEDLYYHQIFFHYVLADGERAQFAGDSAR